MLIFYAILSSCLAVLPPSSNQNTRQSEAHLFVEVAPNPSSSGIFSLETEGCHPEQWIQVRVVNVIGRTVIHQTLTPSQARRFTIDLNRFPRGMYLLEVVQGNCKQVERLMYR